MVLSDLAASTGHSPEPSERGCNRDQWGRCFLCPDVPYWDAPLTTEGRAWGPTLLLWTRRSR